MIESVQVIYCEYRRFTQKQVKCTHLDTTNRIIGRRHGGTKDKWRSDGDWGGLRVGGRGRDLRER